MAEMLNLWESDPPKIGSPGKGGMNLWENEPGEEPKRKTRKAEEQKPEELRGFFGETVSALGAGVIQTMEGIAATAEMIGVPGGETARKEWQRIGQSDALRRPDYLAEGDVLSDPGRLADWRWWVRSLGENTPNLVAMYIPGVAAARAAQGAAWGARAITLFGQRLTAARIAGLGGAYAGSFTLEAGGAYGSAKDEMTREGILDADTIERIATLEGLTAGATNAVIELLPFDNLILKQAGADRLVKRLIRQGFVEGATEGVQEAVNIAVEKLGHKPDQAWSDNIGRILESAIIGGALGAGAGGTIGTAVHRGNIKRYETLGEKLGLTDLVVSYKDQGVADKEIAAEVEKRVEELRGFSRIDPADEKKAAVSYALGGNETKETAKDNLIPEIAAEEMTSYLLYATGRYEAPPDLFDRITGTGKQALSLFGIGRKKAGKAAAAPAGEKTETGTGKVSSPAPIVEPGSSSKAGPEIQAGKEPAAGGMPRSEFEAREIAERDSGGAESGPLIPGPVSGKDTATAAPAAEAEAKRKKDENRKKGETLFDLALNDVSRENQERLEAARLQDEEKKRLEEARLAGEAEAQSARAVAGAANEARDLTAALAGEDPKKQAIVAEVLGMSERVVAGAVRTELGIDVQPAGQDRYEILTDKGPQPVTIPGLRKLLAEKRIGDVAAAEAAHARDVEAAQTRTAEQKAKKEKETEAWALANARETLRMGRTLSRAQLDTLQAARGKLEAREIELLDKGPAVAEAAVPQSLQALGVRPKPAAVEEEKAGEEDRTVEDHEDRARGYLHDLLMDSIEAASESKTGWVETEEGGQRVAAGGWISAVVKTFGRVSSSPLRDDQGQPRTLNLSKAYLARVIDKARAGEELTEDQAAVYEEILGEAKDEAGRAYRLAEEEAEALADFEPETFEKPGEKKETEEAEEEGEGDWQAWSDRQRRESDEKIREGIAAGHDINKNGVYQNREDIEIPFTKSAKTSARIHIATGPDGKFRSAHNFNTSYGSHSGGGSYPSIFGEAYDTRAEANQAEIARLKHILARSDEPQAKTGLRDLQQFAEKQGLSALEEKPKAPPSQAVALAAGQKPAEKPAEEEKKTKDKHNPAYWDDVEIVSLDGPNLLFNPEPEAIKEYTVHVNDETIMFDGDRTSDENRAEAKKFYQALRKRLPEEETKPEAPPEEKAEKEEGLLELKGKWAQYAIERVDKEGNEIVGPAMGQLYSSRTVYEYVGEGNVPVADLKQLEAHGFQWRSGKEWVGPVKLYSLPERAAANLEKKAEEKPAEAAPAAAKKTGEALSDEEFASLFNEAAEEVEAEKKAAPKEPWQMTRDEYLKSLGMDDRFTPPQPKKEGARLVRLSADNVITTGEHGQAVFNAIQEGKPVPAEVRAEYPEFEKIPEKPAASQGVTTAIGKPAEKAKEPEPYRTLPAAQFSAPALAAAKVLTDQPQTVQEIAKKAALDQSAEKALQELTQAGVAAWHLATKRYSQGSTRIEPAAAQGVTTAIGKPAEKAKAAPEAELPPLNLSFTKQTGGIWKGGYQATVTEGPHKGVVGFAHTKEGAQREVEKSVRERVAAGIVNLPKEEKPAAASPAEKPAAAQGVAAAIGKPAEKAKEAPAAGLTLAMLNHALSVARGGTLNGIAEAINSFNRGDIEGARLLAAKAQAGTATDLGFGDAIRKPGPPAAPEKPAAAAKPAEELPDLTVSGQSKPVPGRPGASYVVHKRQPDLIPDTFRVLVNRTEGGILSVDGTGMDAAAAYKNALANYDRKMAEWEKNKPKPKKVEGAEFQEGSRVVITSGRGEGRHGAISNVSSYTMRALFMGTGKDTSERHFSYTMRSDAGTEYVVSSGNLAREEGTAPAVVPDVEIEGRFYEPDHAHARIRYAKEAARKHDAAAQRARKPANIQEERRLAQENRGEAAKLQGIFDAWAAKYPKEAEAAIIADEGPSAAKPAAASQGVAIATGQRPAAMQPGGAPTMAGAAKSLADLGLTVSQGKTNTGKTVWNVSGNTRAHSEQIKRAGGRWYGPKKVWSFYNGDPTAALQEALGIQAGAAPAAPAAETKTEAPARAPEDYAPSTFQPIVREIAAEQGRSNTVEIDGAVMSIYEAAERLADRQDTLRGRLPEKYRSRIPAAPSLGKAASEVAEGVASSFDAIAEILKKAGKGPISMMGGGVFDEELYAAIKPHLQATYDHFRAAAIEVKEWMKEVVRQFTARGFAPDALMPYLQRFYREVAQKDLTKPETGITLESQEGGDRYGTAAGTARSGEGTAENDRTGAQGPGAALLGGVEGGREAGGVPEGSRTGDDGKLRPGGIGAPHEGTRPAGPEGLHGEGAAVDNGGEPGVGGDTRDLAGVQRPAKPRDHRIASPGDLTRPGSWLVTAKNNLDIIDLVKQIERENRPATPAEQRFIARYTGFGASEMRNKLFEGYARTGELQPEWVDEAWKPLVERMVELLTPEEIRTMARSTQYAHYTSGPVVQGIYRALERLGFPGGRILEPGMGSGHFWGLMPEAMRGGSRYTGVEMDHLTASIAKVLYPEQNILEADYSKQAFPNNFFDAAVGNPPFARTVILADPDYKRLRLSLHNYFFVKSLDKIRPGGILAFVTSHYTMDAEETRAREQMAERADLVGAIRLPDTAFKANAGTEVVTDILFFRKRAAGEEPAGEKWINRARIQIPEAAGKPSGVEDINEYFAAHPEMVLGTHSLEGKMYRELSYTVKSSGDLEAQLAEAAGRLPENVYSTAQLPAAEQQELVVERDFNPANRKEGGLYIAQDGKLMRTDRGSGVPFRSLYPDFVAREIEWLKDYCRLRDTLKQAQYDQLKDGPWEDSLQALREVYDRFVFAHGKIRDFALREKKETDEDGNETVVATRIYRRDKLLRRDVEAPLVTALEEITEDGTILPGPFLRGRTIRPPAKPEIRGAADALAVTLDEAGKLDLDRVAEAAGLSREEAIAQLGDLIYEVPGAGHALADEYLSGDVVKKLEEAQAAAAADPKYRRNVEALLKVQPQPLAARDVTVALGGNWIPLEHYDDFAEEVLGLDGIEVGYRASDNNWTVEIGSATTRRRGRTIRRTSGRQSLRGSASEWGTGDRGANELLDSALNSRVVRITHRQRDGSTIVDTAASQACNDIIKRMKERFSTWVWEEAARASELLNIYNRKFNNLAGRLFDGSHMTLPGLSLLYKLHDHQKRAIWRIVQTGNAYLAHAVGSGKTLEMICAGMEMKRLGLIQKPLYIVPNHMLQQFSSDFQAAYPLAHVMIADEQNFGKENRRNFVAQATLNKPDAIVLTHSAFGLLKVTEATVAPVRDDLIAQLRATLEELRESNVSRARIQRIEQRIEQVEQRFAALTYSGNRDDVVNFEEMGVDYLFVDEAHMFRKLDFDTNRQVKGIDPAGSNRGMDLYIKTRWLEAQKPGRSHSFASGTPITNTIAELYTLMRFFIEPDLQREDLGHFDAWANLYAVNRVTPEMNAAGRYEMVERFSEFINIPEMMSRVRTFMDILTASQLAGVVDLPTIRGGKAEIVVTQASEGLKDYQRHLEARIRQSRDWRPSPGQKGNPDPLINIITDGRLASIDLRYVRPGTPNDPRSKLNSFLDGVIESWKEAREIEYTDSATGKVDPVKGGSIVVFYNHGFGANVAETRDFDARGWAMQRFREAGIPANEVGWIDDADNAEKKADLFKAVRQGHKRILIGSAKKMGTGMNVQRRLIALHYLDPPWYPADVEQPDGRIVRQGNLNTSMNREVVLKRYATKGSYDATMWQMVARKSRFTEQAMLGDPSIRKLADLSEASQYEMAAAVASGDERVIRLANLRADRERLQNLQWSHVQEQTRIHGILSEREAAAAYKAKRLKLLAEADKKSPGYIRQIDGQVGEARFDERDEFGRALIEAYNRTAPAEKLVTHAKEVEWTKIAEMDGFDLLRKNASVYNALVLRLAPGLDIELETQNTLDPEKTSPLGLTTRIVNQINGISTDIRSLEDGLEEDKKEVAQARKRIGAPFAYERELAEKIAEIAQLEQELVEEGRAAEAAARAGHAGHVAPTTLNTNPVDQDLAALHPADGGPEAPEGGTPGEQYALGDVTETPAFKKWFGASKVVDAEGKPLVVYHGTHNTFDAFDMEASGDIEIGQYFTNRESVAEDYGVNVMPVYLSIRNPYETTSRIWFETFNEDARDIQKRGFDGIVVRGPLHSSSKNEVTYIPFSPSQVKSVNNRGTFDAADARIQYAVGEKESLEGEEVAELVRELTRTVGGISAETRGGEIYLKTQGGQVCRIKGVTRLAANRIQLDIGYSQAAMEKQTPYAVFHPATEERSAEIHLVRGAAGAWTINHEFYHWLEDLGVVTNRDKNLLNRKIESLIRKDPKTYGRLRGLSPAERRADWTGRQLAGMYDATTETGKILARIRGLIDRILNALGIRTAGGVVRDIQSGKIVNRPGIPGTRRAAAASYAMAGKNAIGQQKLDVAEQMEAEGISRDRIWGETGWWKLGEEWKFEIDDSEAFIRIPAGEWNKKLMDTPAYTLPGILQHPTLYQAYPKLKGIKVHSSGYPSMLGGIGSKAFYDDKNKEIHVLGPAAARGGYKPVRKTELKSVLFHEVQHVIQDMEDFARGGDVKEFTILDPDAISSRHHRLFTAALRFKEKGNPEEVRQELLAVGYEASEIEEAESVSKNTDAETLKKINKERDDILERAADPYKSYRLLAGEAESRLVQKRLEMMPEDRKWEPPWITLENMLREEGILREGQNIEDALIRLPRKEKSEQYALGPEGGEAAGSVRAEKLSPGESLRRTAEELTGAAGQAAGRAGSRALGLLGARVSPETKDALGVLARHWKEFWRPFSTVKDGEKILAKRYEAMGNVARAVRFIEEIHQKLDAYPPEVKKDMFWYLNGDIPLEILPVDARETAEMIRRRFETIGEMLVDRGLLAQGQFDKYRGRYIHYLYARHVLGDKFSDAFLTSTGKLNLSYAKSRKDLTLQQRKELGLIEDASVAVPVGMGKALTDLAKADYLETIAENADWVWQPSLVKVPIGKPLKEPVRGRTRRNVTMGVGKLVEELKAYDRMMEAAPTREVEEIRNILRAALDKAEAASHNMPGDFVQLPNSKGYGALAGAYVKKPIADDLMPILDVATDRGKLFNAALEIERQGMAVFKMGKVALNLPTAVRNVVSNIIQNNMRGRPLSKIPGDIIRACEELKAKGTHYEEAFGMGLFHTNWFVSEINDVLDEFKKVKGGRIDQILIALKNVAKYYGKIDDINKLAIFIEQRKAGKTVDEAALEAMKWGMDYSLTSRSIKGLRQTIMPFATYQYKIAPLIAESLRKRPWVLAKYGLLFTAAKAAAMALHDLDDDDWDELERQLPAYIKKAGSMMILPWQTDKGQWQWVNLEYFFPWGNYMAIFRDMRQADLGETIRDAGISNPFLSMFVTGITAREDQPPLHAYFGTPIYNDLDPGWMKAAKVVEYMANTWMPSMLTRQGAIGYTGRAIAGGEDRWGREVTGAQALGRWFGANIVSVSPDQTRAQASVRIQEKRKELSRIEANPSYDEKEKAAYRQRFNEELAEVAKEAPAAVLPITKAKGPDPVYEALRGMAAAGSLHTGPPSRSVEIAGVPLKMTPAQYGRYLEASSETARRKLLPLVGAEAWARMSDQRKGETVAKIVAAARKAARQRIKAEVARENREKILEARRAR